MVLLSPCRIRTVLRSVLPALLAGGAAVWVGLLPAQAAAPTHDLKDMADTTVTVPVTPKHIADLWFAHNEVMAMLGAADRVAVTVDRPTNQPWLFRLAPALSGALAVEPGAADPEALLARNVDVALVSSGLTQASPLRQAGLPVMVMSFKTIAGLRKSIALTADLLGDATARQRASQYETLLQAELTALDAKLKPLPAAKRPRVLHLARVFPLMVDGRGSIIDSWITTAGGRNVAAGVKGPHRPVTMEQIMAWDPDVIIVQGGDHHLEQGHVPAGWAGLRAVREQRVYANPEGAFPWDRYGSEFLLQIRWAAGILHPDLFDQRDLIPEMKTFYRIFFDHDLTDAEADLMLHGLPPAP